MASVLRCIIPRPQSHTNAGCWTATNVALRYGSRSPITSKPSTKPLTPLRHGGPYSREEDELIQTRRRQGAKWRDIAEELGVMSAGSVRCRYHYRQKHANAASWNGTRHHEWAARVPWDVEAKETLKKHYRMGASIVDVAGKMNRTVCSVQSMIGRLLDDSQVERRNAAARPFTSAEFTQAALWRGNGMLYKDIGERLGRTPQSVRQALCDGSGDAVRRPPSAWSPAETAELFRLLREGFRLAEAGERLQRTVFAVRRRLAVLKLRIPNDGSPRWYMTISDDELRKNNMLGQPQPTGN